MTDVGTPAAPGRPPWPESHGWSRPTTGGSKERAPAPTLQRARLAEADHGSAQEAEILYPTLHELLGKGLVRLRDLPTEEGAIEKVAERIGSIRTTNFGHLFNRGSRDVI